MITCPTCGKQNRREARFCQYCGADFSPTRPMSTTPPRDDMPSQSEGHTVARLFQAAKRWVTGEEPPPLPPQPAPPLSPAPVQPPAETQPDTPSLQPTPPAAADQYAPLQRGDLLSHPHIPQQRYGITVTRELSHSVYYDALDLTCPSCGLQRSKVPSSGLCSKCQATLQTVLIHQRRWSPSEYLSDKDMEELIQLSASHQGILSHHAIIQRPEGIYTVVKHPGRWGVLVRGRRKRLPQEALSGAVQVGQVLAYLHDKGFSHSEVGGGSMESLITVGGSTDLRLANLSSCVRLRSNDAQALRVQINNDVTFLAWLLFYLATGKELSRSNLEFMPPKLRPFVERALGGQYASIRDMLTDFSLMPSTPASARSLKPSHGQSTHPGQKHRHNEDAVVTFTFDKEQEGHAVPIGFFLVADGMGGHSAGDVASRTVNQTVTDWIIHTKVLPDLQKATRKLEAEDLPSELLTQAIQRANDLLLRHRQAKGSDLGSTLTAALVIGDVATVANVGDSRTYLLRESRLDQITQDHSLVARLVDADVIKPEEVRTHPRRNQIYRYLGHKASLEVDTFIVQLQRGDRLILCSDGLWEMVQDQQIHRIMEQSRSPQQACDALVEAANRAGGEDNIAVIVVEME